MSPGHQTARGRSAGRSDVVVVENHALVRHVVNVSYLLRCNGCLRLPLVGV